MEEKSGVTLAAAGAFEPGGGSEASRFESLEAEARLSLDEACQCMSLFQMGLSMDGGQRCIWAVTRHATELGQVADRWLMGGGQASDRWLTGDGPRRDRDLSRGLIARVPVQFTES